jgi:hypothetical protein
MQSNHVKRAERHGEVQPSCPLGPCRPRSISDKLHDTGQGDSNSIELNFSPCLLLPDLGRLTAVCFAIHTFE